MESLAHFSQCSGLPREQANRDNHDLLRSRDLIPPFACLFDPMTTCGKVATHRSENYTPKGGHHVEAQDNHPRSAPPPSPAPRLLAQLITATGELVIVAIAIVGTVVVVNWLLIGFDVTTRPARHEARPSAWVLRCWYDRRYGGEICEPPYRAPPMRPFYARDRI
jgi:hypothetical protein